MPANVMADNHARSGPVVAHEPGPHLRFHFVALATQIPNTPDSRALPSDRPTTTALPRRRRLTRTDRARIVELYREGRSTRWIADEMNLGRTTVLDNLKREGVLMRPPGNSPNHRRGS